MIDGTVSNGKLFEDCFGSETHVDECHPREWCHIDQTNIGAGSRTDGSPEYHIRHVVTASRDCLHPSSSLIHAYAQHSSSTHTSCPQHTLLPRRSCFLLSQCHLLCPPLLYICIFRFYCVSFISWYIRHQILVICMWFFICSSFVFICSFFFLWENRVLNHWYSDIC